MLPIPKFNVGDRVVAITDCPNDGRYILRGYLGSVCDVHHDSGGYTFGVDWDDLIGGHRCNGNCPSGHGWYVHGDEIELFDWEPAAGIVAEPATEAELLAFIGGVV